MHAHRATISADVILSEAKSPVTPTTTRIHTLPDGFEALLAESLADGFGALKRMKDEWDSGANMFNRPGEALFEARLQGRLAGICGLNIDPYRDAPDHGRLRHLYVAVEHRRSGVGRLLVQQVLAHAALHFTVVRLRSNTPSGPAFFEAIGFGPVKGDSSATHQIHLPRP